jgi:hypothetical protein
MANESMTAGEALDIFKGVDVPFPLMDALC